MIVFIIGGSGSGKSAYAENVCMELAGNTEKCYLATMQVYGKEGERTVERHRALRAGKGFETIEQPVKIEQAAGKVTGRTVLLECLSNLLANEMFSVAHQAKEEVVNRITEGIEAVTESAEHLVIVSNNVAEDGICYPKETQEYIEVLGSLNQYLCKKSDRAVEVVASIPIFLKGAEQ